MDQKTQKTEFDKFTSLVDRVISVPRSEIKRRMDEYEKNAALNLKRRGPKRKAVRPSSSHDSDASG